MKKKIFTAVLTLMLCFTAMFTLSACGEESLKIDTNGETQFNQGCTITEALKNWTLTYDSEENFYIEKNPNKAPAGSTYDAERGGWRIPVGTYSAVNIIKEGKINSDIVGLLIEGFDTSTVTANTTRMLTFVLYGESVSIQYTVVVPTT